MFTIENSEYAKYFRVNQNGVISIADDTLGVGSDDLGFVWDW